MLRIAGLALLWILFAGCASVQPPPENLENLIDMKPLVKVGSVAPHEKDYILYVPAGQEFPVRLSLNGTLLDKGGEAEAVVSFVHDVYLYGQWASYDGRRWEELNKLIGLKISAGMDVEGAVLKIDLQKFNKK
jgi:hypothetical protein